MALATSFRLSLPGARGGVYGRSCRLRGSAIDASMNDLDVIRFLRRHRASELLLEAGEPPRLRTTEGVQELDLPRLDARAVAEFVGELLNAREKTELEQAGAFSRERKWPNREHGLRIQASRGRASLGWNGP